MRNAWVDTLAMTGVTNLPSPFDSDLDVTDELSLLTVLDSFKRLVSCCRREGRCGPSLGELLVEFVFTVPVS